MAHLAIDIGASGGRAHYGAVEDGRLRVREVHRFANARLDLPGGLFWNAPGLFQEVKRSLAAAVATGERVETVGIDTWAVDYAFLGRSGEILGLPRHYRDPRTRGLAREVGERIGRQLLYHRTGVQFQDFNTLCQLIADGRTDRRRLETAERFLFMPDLLHYWLTGDAATEATNAGTSQFFDPRRGVWDREVLESFEIPSHFLPEVRRPGSSCGPLRAAVAAETGAKGTRVVRPATHDTASAVIAVPASGDAWAYISCGTWSLVGVELSEPNTSSAALAANFSNEVGWGGTIRFLKNVPGLWLIQECLAAWSKAGRTIAPEDLDDAAAKSRNDASLIDPDDPLLLGFGPMPEKIRRAAKRFGVAPESDADIIACIYRSLALKHRLVLDELREVTGKRIDTIHLVGGGSQSERLCRWTADAAARPVVAGPLDATATGNLLAQSYGDDTLESLGEIRRVTAASTELRVYEPESSERWNEAAAKMRRGGAV